MNDKALYNSIKNEPSRFLALLVLLCLGGGLLVLYGSSFAGALQSNFGWLNLNTHMRSGTAFSINLTKGSDHFVEAVEANPGNQSAWFGLGYSYALQGDADAAISTWSDSETNPAALIDYGMAARSKGDFDTALIYFRAADANDYAGSKEGYVLAGTVCQRSFALQHQLSDSNLRYCSNYLVENDNNLVINGDFSTRTVYGWEGEHFFTGKNAARLQIEDLVEPNNSVVSLIGQDENNHFGLYQPLTLIPGDSVRFSGRFKLSGEENLTARLLYISWQNNDGAPQGNHGAEQNELMEWTEFERKFRVPEDVKSTINFYPVNFAGEGTIWFDDIRLEMIHE